MSERKPDYEGSIKWAHDALDTWGAPVGEGNAIYSVSGRIHAKCSADYAEIERLTAEVAALKEAGREEVRQFNAGHDAFFAGEPSDAAPSFEVDYDVWTCGWAWGKFLKEQADNG